MRVFIEVIDALGVELGGTSFDPVHLIAFF
jgi:hypothetical protein